MSLIHHYQVTKNSHSLPRSCTSPPPPTRRGKKPLGQAPFACGAEFSIESNEARGVRQRKTNEETQKGGQLSGRMASDTSTATTTAVPREGNLSSEILTPLLQHCDFFYLLVLLHIQLLQALPLKKLLTQP